jgi:hypothetical protein
MIYLSPLLFVTGFYLCKDPFKVLYHYDAYYAPADTSYFELDDDYVSTQTLIQNSRTIPYDSYIFGSSRSDNYMVAEFGRHVRSSNCYHFNAAYESLYGVERKMQYLKANGMQFKNALIIFDNELLAKVTNDKGHIRIKHPALTGQNRLQFQLEFFKDFFDKDFLFAYMDMSFSGKLKPYMIEKDIMSLICFQYDSRANEIYQAKIENEIAANNYYSAREHIFYKRDSVLKYTTPVLRAGQKKLLRNMKTIMNELHTSYRIVISPLYNQLQFNQADLITLQQIFGKEYVFDFSGINSLTDDRHNYYETSHYRPKVCTEIMNAVYGNKD